MSWACAIEARCGRIEKIVASGGIGVCLRPLVPRSITVPAMFLCPNDPGHFTGLEAIKIE